MKSIGCPNLLSLWLLHRRVYDVGKVFKCSTELPTASESFFHNPTRTIKSHWHHESILLCSGFTASMENQSSSFKKYKYWLSHAPDWLFPPVIKLLYISSTSRSQKTRYLHKFTGRRTPRWVAMNVLHTAVSYLGVKDLLFGDCLKDCMPHWLTQSLTLFYVQPAGVFGAIGKVPMVDSARDVHGVIQGRCQIQDRMVTKSIFRKANMEECFMKGWLEKLWGLEVAGDNVKDGRFARAEFRIVSLITLTLIPFVNIEISLGSIPSSYVTVFFTVEWELDIFYKISTLRKPIYMDSISAVISEQNIV